MRREVGLPSKAYAYIAYMYFSTNCISQFLINFSIYKRVMKSHFNVRKKSKQDKCFEIL